MGRAPPWLLPGMRLYTISSAALDLVFSHFHFIYSFAQ